MVLLEAVVGISDRADDSGAQIAHPADQIDQAISKRIVKHPADSEVAADSVFLDRAKAHRRRPASVGIFSVGAERRDFEQVVVDQHAYNAELRAHRDGTVEHFLHDLGTRVGCDVVVLGLDAEHAITHTSAVENGDKAGINQPTNDVQRFLLFVAQVRLSSSAFYSRALGGCYKGRKELDFM
ncbi:MAG: hypothetical protein ABSD30_02520 [Candidatus Binatus sp.]